MRKLIYSVFMLALALCLCLSVFAGCKTTKTADVSSTPSVEQPAPETEQESIEESQPEEDVTEDPFEELPTEEPTDDEIDMAQDLYIYNKQKLSDDFLGIGVIHNLYNYMPDKDGRTYNEKQIGQELDTLKETRIKMIRSFYGSTLAWDPVKQEHNYESPYMTAFYKNCHDMADLGIEIGITMQWSLEGFVRESKSKMQGVSIYENGYVVPGDLAATQKNFATFTEESVLAFQAHGVNNIKYIFAFTECNNMYTLPDDGKMTTAERRQFHKVYPVFHAGIDALDTGLKNAGLRDRYQIVGPCDSGSGDDDERDYSRLVKYVSEHLTDQVDIIGSHHGGYVKNETYATDSFYDYPQTNFPTAIAQAEAMGKDYWHDEINVGISNVWGPAAARSYVNVEPWKGVALGAMVNSVMNLGKVDTMFLWGLYDQQWPNSTSAGAASEFDNGIQLVGYLPSLLESAMPYKPYYAMSLLTRYIGSGELYACEIGYSVYLSAIRRDDGEWTVVVTNYNFEDTDIRINFEASMGGKNFYRHLYNVNTVTPVIGADTIPADAVAKNVTVGFADTLAGGSVAVYTTEKP